jgi:hypothetical protein
MSWIERLMAMFRRPQTPPTEGTRVMLDDAENRMAGRLSKLKGVTRDEVLAEAYRRARRARLLEESESYRKPS